ALQYIHAMGVIHRDVKPENVLLDRHEIAQLCDFGIALNPAHRATQIGDRMGTPSFMAPEQYNDPASVTPSADIFGLGATMYTGLTAKSPMSLVVGHLRQKALEILPGDVAPIIERATAPGLESRYASAEEMAMELAELS
ncbi:MAG TPA: serine/threonine protein kinase, partial [Deltaproteobacteria bacterium]|nr:serine/threonine protein kinase [Deltaproteobacteria bacterium]